MALTIGQRLDRVKVRLDELYWWREREAVPVEGWTFEGTPIALGDFWPAHEGTVGLAAGARVPEAWPIAETRLVLDLGGEALVSLRYEDGGTVRFGNDPYHREHPVRGHVFSIDAEAVARLPFGEPVREPRLTAARLTWLDTAVHALHLRLRQVAEAAEQLAGHEVVPHLVAAAEQAFYALDWPSATADHVARFAPQAGQQRIWQLPELKAAPAGLDDVQRASVIEADRTLIDALRELKARFPPQGRIALT